MKRNDIYTAFFKSLLTAIPKIGMLLGTVRLFVDYF